MHRQARISAAVPAARPRPRFTEHAAMFAVVVLVLAVAYFTVVGVIATAIAQGWTAA